MGPLSDDLNTGDVLIDLVNKPPHYNSPGGMECIEAIQAMLGDSGFLAYCQGNIIKYCWRWEHKGREQDLEKAQWYLGRMLDTLEVMQERQEAAGDA